MITPRVKELMQESGSTPMDLIRFGMAQGTAYGVARNKIHMIHERTLDMLCDFFTERLGREVNPGDILYYTHEKK
jgi:hypothetical protein